MVRASVGAVGVLWVVVMGACAGEAPVPSGAVQSVAIVVAPLTLDGVTNASWRLTVANGSDELVWTRDVDADRFGDGAGSLSYVGPCDADDPNNSVTVELLELYRGAAAVVPTGEYVNPGPLSQRVACVANADVAVRFEVTIARAAEQGFFDIALDLDDLFCSAKLDCQQALLFDAGGVRRPTFVLGFACTADLTADATVLYLDDLVIDCDGAAEDATVDPSAGPGLLTAGGGVSQDATDPLVFSAAVYTGDEQLTSGGQGAGKVYWNVAVGIVADRGANCHLRTHGTAAAEVFTANATPALTSYPVIAWDVALTDGGGQLLCANHPVGGGDGVSVGYTPLTAPRTFAHSSAGSAGVPQAMLIPAYFYPDWWNGTYSWTPMLTGAPTGSVAIMNPNSGPDAAVNPDYEVALADAQAAGLTVIGYVWTDYGARAAALVDADIDAYYAFYPDLDGIFFDGTPSADDAPLQAWYAARVAHARAQAVTVLTVLNPGTLTAESWYGVADVLTVFEDDAAAYVGSADLPGWTASYPAGGFAHLIHDAASADLASLVALGEARNAALMYVTDDTYLPDYNPWDTLPSYLAAESALLGGR